MVNLGAAEDARGSPPPATRTRPSERHVIEKSCRAVTMLPVVDHVFVDGSKSSALATVPKLAFPAATSTFPLASVHAPKLRRGVLMLPTAVHVRPERIVNLSGCGRDVVTRVTACHQDRAIFQQRSDMVLSSHVHRERARAPGGRQQYPGVDGGTLHALRNARFEGSLPGPTLASAASPPPEVLLQPPEQHGSPATNAISTRPRRRTASYMAFLPWTALQ